MVPTCVGRAGPDCTSRSPAGVGCSRMAVPACSPDSAPAHSPGSSLGRSSAPSWLLGNILPQQSRRLPTRQHESPMAPGAGKTSLTLLAQHTNLTTRSPFATACCETCTRYLPVYRLPYPARNSALTASTGRRH